MREQSVYYHNNHQPLPAFTDMLRKLMTARNEKPTSDLRRQTAKATSTGNSPATDGAASGTTGISPRNAPPRRKEKQAKKRGRN